MKNSVEEVSSIRVPLAGLPTSFTKEAFDRRLAQALEEIRALLPALNELRWSVTEPRIEIEDGQMFMHLFLQPNPQGSLFQGATNAVGGLIHSRLPPLVEDLERIRSDVDRTQIAISALGNEMTSRSAANERAASRGFQSLPAETTAKWALLMQKRGGTPLKFDLHGEPATMEFPEFQRFSSDGRIHTVKAVVLNMSAFATKIRLGRTEACDQWPEFSHYRHVRMERAGKTRELRYGQKLAELIDRHIESTFKVKLARCSVTGQASHFELVDLEEMQSPPQ